MTCLADWAAMRPKLDGRQRLGDEIAELGGAVLGLRVRQIDLVRRLLDVLDHFQQPPEAQFAGARVDLGAHIGLGAVAGLCRLLDGVLHGFDDDHAVDRLFARHGIGDLQQFEAIRADGHLVDLL